MNIIKRLIVPVILILAAIWFFNRRNNERDRLIENSALIEQQVKNVSKLIVSEGYFSEVFRYEDSKKLYFDILSAKKKALIVVNAKVIVAYDLKQLQTELDEENKIIRILKIPQAEITINPDIEYYDMQQDYLNQFSAEDYNKVKKRINKKLQDKIQKSDMIQNAENRLVTELSNIYLLSKSLGWKVYYINKPIESQNDIEFIGAGTVNLLD